MIHGDDDSSCSGCGCDMEVIGPPGPRHRKGCPVKAAEDKDHEESCAAQEREFMARLSRPIHTVDSLFLTDYFDSVLLKHHPDGFSDWDDEYDDGDDFL